MPREAKDAAGYLLPEDDCRPVFELGGMEPRPPMPPLKKDDV